MGKSSVWGYYPGTYYEHEFRVKADPNWDKISYGGQYITNLPDGYVDEDDLGVGGNAEKIQDGKWYYSYVWISGPSGVHQLLLGRGRGHLLSRGSV